ncbi:hypothetical protein BD413DRAFT_614960 [Trametes elegans]|nr:hypothetical protein BD413DRAFT_614960 [Trametes elegans]
MSQTTLETPTRSPGSDAPHPFNQPSADIILRTPNERTAEDNPAVVDVSEGSDTLELLLRILYPISKPSMEDLGSVVPALKAALKYDMEWPVAFLSERLVTITTTEVLNGMNALGDLDGISAGDYLRLKTFLQASRNPLWEEGAPGPELLLGHISPSTEHPLPSAMFSTSLRFTDVVCSTSPKSGTPVLFHAHQINLSLHSPVWRARIEGDVQNGHFSTSDPSNPGDIACRLSSERPVLALEDVPSVVSGLLRACYEGKSSMPNDLRELADLLLGARKYGMSLSRVADWILEAWTRAAGSDPPTAYFLAIRHGFLDIAKAAADLVLQRPF